MQEKTYPNTFSSYDKENEKILIAPHGNDPVFYGLRGENPSSVINASKLIETNEKLDGYMIFKTNQGTSEHLKHKIDVKKLKPYTSGIVTGIILDKPKMERGGHVFFSLALRGQKIRCGIYKPTKITAAAMGLIQGDKICVGGGIRKASKNHKRILNVEFFKILQLVKNLKSINPICKKCNKKMKSKGKNQGFKCVKCKNKSYNKTIQEIQRKIKQKLYIPSVSAHRHLTRPMQRIGKLNCETTFDNSIPWFYVYKN